MRAPLKGGGLGAPCGWCGGCWRRRVSVQVASVGRSGSLTAGGGRRVSEADMRGTGPRRATFERTRDEVLREERPLPPDDEVLIGDFPEERGRAFAEAHS